MTLQTTYQPVIWDRALPTPVGLFAKTQADEQNPTEQKLAASKILDFMTAATAANYDSINSIATPVPLLIPIPSTNKVRFVLGLSVF